MVAGGNMARKPVLGVKYVVTSVYRTLQRLGGVCFEVLCKYTLPGKVLATPVTLISSSSEMSVHLMILQTFL